MMKVNLDLGKPLVGQRPREQKKEVHHLVANDLIIDPLEFIDAIRKRVLTSPTREE